MINKSGIALLGALLLHGCANNTGIIETGRDTYMVSRQAATGFSGSGSLKAEAVSEANAFCTRKKKTLKVENVIEAQPPYILGNFPKAEVQFVCQDDDSTYVSNDRKTQESSRKVASKNSKLSQLNPSVLKAHSERDAVAIIIGIQNYKRVAKAEFANEDALVFANYAEKILGIRPENIKLLIDSDADDVEIYRAFQNWLPLKVKKNKTDVIVFYSGHGLPSDDGKSLYFMPHGADKDFITRTAINQQEIVANIQATQPKSVMMFIDSCYSGQTRSGDTLLASARPLSIKSQAAGYPSDFTVITASAPDQISWSSPDLQHGIFSYYLMKAIEGEADENKDGNITAGEIQLYLSEQVSRQALSFNRKQQTQLYGDMNKVVVER